MKYIIDIPTELAEATARYWNETTDMTLVPYIEPDQKAIEDEVWQFVRMFSCLGNCAISEIGDDENTTDPLALVEKYSYQQVKSKYEAWLKQKDEIHVGDEVIPRDGTWRGVVVDVDDGDLTIMGNKGISACGYKSKHFSKTGRHFNEVAELLEKMRGEEE